MVPREGGGGRVRQGERERDGERERAEGRRREGERKVSTKLDNCRTSVTRGDRDNPCCREAAVGLAVNSAKELTRKRKEGRKRRKNKTERKFVRYSCVG